MPSTKKHICPFLTLCLLFSSWLSAEVQFRGHEDSAMVQFAAEKIEQAAKGKAATTVSFTLKDDLPEQGYTIESDGKVIKISGGDERGLMYGGLELAERLTLGQSIEALYVKEEPFIAQRGLKMNIPLDARCPSYDDSGTSARMNIAEVWSEEFWHAFFDRMAENRYNTLTLWSNHPFTAMLDLEKYPDVALDDVAVPTYELEDQMLPQYMHRQLQDPKNYKIIKEMPIAEKVAFWQRVMAYAKDRGIDIYFITWNIWTHGATGKYGITPSQTSDATIAYFRESVKQFILTYPDLKGIGITCGEHMKNKLEGEYAVENWMWNTYGMGVIDAKAEDPDREVHFIHRIWYSGIDVMVEDFISKYPDPITVSFKYARARLYSIPNPPFFKNEQQGKIEEHGLSSWMNLRNDDIFNFRWGDPDYVREFMRNLPPEPIMAGYYMGSDGYVWGREFTSKDPESPRQLEIDKHWYNFMLWGRLGYNPKLDRDFFEAQLQQRFPEVDSPQLYKTWQTASKIVPFFNTYHWRNWDHMWSIENLMSRKEGFHSVNHLIEFAPLPGQGMQGIRDYVKNPNPNMMSPLDVANELDRLSAETLTGVETLRKDATGKELKQTLNDLEAFAQLSAYLADKTRGALLVHQFRVNGNPEDQLAAMTALESALKHWQAYADIASAQYEEQLLARTSYTDWDGMLHDYVKADIQIAKDAQQNEFPETVIHSYLNHLKKEKQ
ncbi:hypothetical protein [Rubellicoccus peritrichatus]|uniref:Uncharacterized protein n=1 Tax=Rubellicoccus peritrichatus TaxID=3080537 RepID=A0AAQ3LBH3_9BACT|nr:hypothetical protein [Puniceicoccus sp. CR14]WOO42800.1 hypothetical protein RZN69_06825 [Puniceicoccus sp. CR14]